VASHVAKQEALAVMVQKLGWELDARVRANVVAPFVDTALWSAKPREEIDASIRSYAQINPPGHLGTMEKSHRPSSS
jgi:hypothetical protein